MVNSFFGDQSPFSILIALVALTTGAYTFYKSFIERAKLHLFPTRHIQFVSPTHGGRLKLRLSCTLTNSGVKLGVLQFLAARVSLPSGDSREFLWEHLIHRASESFTVQVAPVSAVAVAPKSSQAISVELSDDSAGASWAAGDHTILICGWVNRPKSRPANLTAMLNATLSDIDDFVLEPESQRVISVPVVLAS